MLREIDIETRPRRARKAPPPTDPGPFRSRSLAPIGWIVVAVLAGAGLLLYLTSPGERPRPAVQAAADAPIPPPPPPPPRPVPSKALPPPEPDTPNDVLGHAADYKAVYLRYRDSRDPIERALAGRAHRACFPAFLPPAGQAPSPAHRLRALPDKYRAERSAAIEALFKRCRSFLTQPLDAAEIVGTAERVVNGDLASPGAAARWGLMRGDRAGAEAAIQRAFTSKEPYAIQSLSGLSMLMMNPKAGGADSAITDAALALLACDLGAACGADALLALELCAGEGRCEGSARERMLARIGTLDPEAVQRERERLRTLLDRGSATIATVWQGPR
jgi:hypothetical protein